MREFQPWTMEDSLRFIRRLYPTLKEAGFSVALTGSVLFDGESKNDLDLVIYPQNASEYSLDKLHNALKKEGLKVLYPRHVVAKAWAALGSNDTKVVESWMTGDNHRIDVFLLR